ncbi:hypothetical protein V2O64_16660 [Verrucomicrobiaceae bacterium 227]
MKTPLFNSLILIGSAVFANGAAIGVNFSENSTNQGWLASDVAIGPLSILTGNFNSTNNPNANGPANTLTGDLSNGTMADMVDDAGVAIPTTITWASANPWYNSSGTANDEERLAVGYLDDGGNGASISVSNIPYATYNVLILLGSDAGDTHDSESPLVNGVAVLDSDFPAFGNLTGSGGGWIEADGTNRGNYVVARGLSGSSLTIAGQNNTANRIGISGFVIQQIPEPSSALLALCGSAFLIRRRRA